MTRESPSRRALVQMTLLALLLLAIAASLATAVADAEAPEVDGVISSGEYAQSKEFADGNYTLHWQVEGDDVFLGIEGRTGGMVALGIEPETAMLHADMVIGWVSPGGEPTVLDCWSQGNYGPHPPDEDQGGSDDLDEATGTEDGGVTTLEVRRALDTGDDKDRVVPAAGDVDIIWAMSDADDLNTQHTARGPGTISMDGGDGPAPEDGIDGRISPGEYPLHATLSEGHFDLYWAFQGDTIKMGLRAKASGMVAIGIDPERRMRGADMIIGYRSGSTFTLHDAYGFGETGNHPDDVDEGGTFDVNAYEIGEVGGVTTIELTRLLDTGDHLDKVIPTEGNLDLIWATSDTDDLDAYHGRRGTAIIDMGTGEAETIEHPTLWPFHAFLMGAATICFVATWFTVVYKKKLKKKFLDHHHTVGSLGVVLAIVGLIIGIYMVGQLDSGHIRVTHSVLAIVTLVLSMATFIVGQVFMSVKRLKRKARKPHIYLGGISIIMMAVTSIAGLMYVFPV